MGRPSSRRASGSTATSTSCGRRSGTRSTARSSIRSTPSCARSSGSTKGVEIARAAAAHRPHDLHLESQEPSRLPGRAARARRQRHPAAGHRRRHQSVRRSAGAAPPPRHGRDPDPAQHQGSRVPRHAQGVRRGAAAAARPDVLHRGRPQLHRRDEGAEDGAAARRDAERPNRRRRFFRWRSRTTWCSRITCWRIRARSGASGRSVARSRRWCGTPSGYQSRAFVTFGKPIPLDGLDGRRAPRRDGPRAPGARHHRPAAQGAADRGGCGRHAAFHRPPRSRESRRGRSSGSCVPPARTSASRSGREAVELGAPMLADRGIIHVERGGLFRVRERTVLRYYARTLQHLLTGPGRAPRTH